MEINDQEKYLGSCRSITNFEKLEKIGNIFVRVWRKNLRSGIQCYRQNNRPKSDFIYQRLQLKRSKYMTKNQDS